MTLSGAAGKVPVGPLRREGLGYGCQPKSLCQLSRLGRRRSGYYVCGCLWKPDHHSPCPPFAKRGVWNSFSISLLVRYIILSLSCRFFRRVGVGKSVSCLSVFPTGRGGISDGWLQLVGFLGPGQIEVIPPGLSVWLSRHRLQQTAAFQSGKQSGSLLPLAVQQPSRHWPVKGSHRACRWLSSARWYPGPTAAAAPANGRTAACFRREVPGKVLPTEGWTGSSGSCRCGSGFPLRERVHGSDGTSLGYGLVADFGFWHPSFPVGFVLERCLIISL